MVDKSNRYSKMQKDFYDLNAPRMAQTDHSEHNANQDYWNILVGDVRDDYYENRIALDFGCGTGRNVQNLYFKTVHWVRVDGVDISENNISFCKEKMKECGADESKYKFYVNNGVDLAGLKSEEYDFVMSTIVFQHIAVHDIRFNLMKEIYRVMKPGALFSFQMGYGPSPGTVGYFENYYDATGTNSACDVRIENADELITDLKKIGFLNINYFIRPSFSNAIHEKWIYVKAYK